MLEEFLRDLLRKKILRNPWKNIWGRNPCRRQDDLFEKISLRIPAEANKSPGGTFMIKKGFEGIIRSEVFSAETSDRIFGEVHEASGNELLKESQRKCLNKSLAIPEGTSGETSGETSVETPGGISRRIPILEEILN